jgi:hypothetical protein
MDQLRCSLRAAGPARWPQIADAINQGRADGEHVSVHLMRKIAYGDRENPRVQTIQPLLDHFGIGAQEAA